MSHSYVIILCVSKLFDHSMCLIARYYTRITRSQTKLLPVSNILCFCFCLCLSLPVYLPAEIWSSERAGIFELHQACTKILQNLLKLTVVGFPTAAGTALQALLHEHFVMSWKIVGSGENLTFALRLSPAAIDSETATSFAHTQDNKQPPVQCYRRKPPSQIRRNK